MDKKVTGIVAYITIIGWLVAYLAGDKEGAKFHINQGLVSVLFGMVCGVINTVITLIGIPFVGIIFSVLPFVVMIMGIVYAAQEQDKEIPVIGTIKLLK